MRRERIGALLGELGLLVLAGVVVVVAVGYALACPLALARAASAGAEPQMTSGVLLPGEMAPGRLTSLTSLPSTPMSAADAGNPLTLTLTLKRADQAGFERLLAAIQDPRSRLYRHYLTQAQLAARFGPTPQAYSAVLHWLRTRGFVLVRGSDDRLSLTVRATRSQAERAFDTPIRDFRLGDRSVYANVTPPRLPAAIAPRVQAVSGLADTGSPQSEGVSQSEIDDACESAGSNFGTSFGLVPSALQYLQQWWFLQFELDGVATIPVSAFLPGSALIDYFLWPFIGTGLYLYALWTGVTIAYCAGLTLGHGAVEGFLGNYTLARKAPHGALTPVPAHAQKIGLLEFDTYRPSDVSDWLSLIGVQPTKAEDPRTRLSEVAVNGGVSQPGAGESEVLLDIDSVIGLDPRAPAHYVVYDAPPSTSFVQMFNTMLEDGDTVISNSWSQCEDDTPRAEAEAIDSVLAQAAASGVSVFNGTGDHGGSCLDGSANTIGVPADSPHATAVGGSAPKLGPLESYEGSSWWGVEAAGQGGEGGYGVSRYFARPSYQNGFTSSSTRSVPDVAVNANPRTGVDICQADAGGCPAGRLYGGTSMAAPEMAALTADLNQKLGKNVGFANQLLYPLNGTNAFHSPASMKSDFAHVGLGEPAMDNIALALGGGGTGAVSATKSIVKSSLVTPADGKSHAMVEVALADEQGLPVSGKHVTLTLAAGGHAVVASESPVSNEEGIATFALTDATVEHVALKVSDTSDGITLPEENTGPPLEFVAPAATGGEIYGGPSDVIDDGGSQAKIMVYLQDDRGRPAIGKTVKLTGGGSAVIAPADGEAETNSEGIATFTATDTAQESVAFTAVDETDDTLPVPGSLLVNFQEAGASPCADTLPHPTAGSPVSVASFATGFPDNTQGFEAVYEGILFRGGPCAGIDAPTFDESGNVYVPDEANGQIYEFGPSGGSAGITTALPHTVPGLEAVAFGKEGQLFATLDKEGNLNQPELVQLNRSTGAIERVLATKATGMYDFPTYMAVDPVSGDVFVVDDGGGLGTEHFLVTRVHEPDSASPTLEDYGDVAGVQTGITFAPDGTMYVGVVDGPHENEVLAVGATNSGSPGAVTPVIKIPTGYLFGVAVAESDDQGHATVLDIVNNEGDIYRVDLTQHPATATEIAERPSIFTRGGAIGPDGCLYYQDQDMLLKITGVSGRCSGSQGGDAGPQIGLSDSGPESPPTGTTSQITASLTGFPSVSGQQVTFVIDGANGGVRLAHADANGHASFTYSGVFPGVDTIEAFAESGGKDVQSAPLTIHWSEGKQTSFLSLDASQQSGPVGQPATFTANLRDIGQEPATPIAGASVTIAIAGRECEAVTDAHGDASCSIAPPGPLGLETVTATYGGSGAYTPSTASSLFEAGGIGLASPGGPPTKAPTSTPPAAGAPTPTAHTGIAALKAVTAPRPLATILGLPPATACVSKRRLVVHVHPPAGQQLRGVTLTLGRKRLRSLRFDKRVGHKIPSTVVDLKGLPKGAFTLEIVVVTKSGKVYRATRTYHTCVSGKSHRHTKKR
jgi:Pro-kumamolisin, activation domain/Bacterial Ig-like domain (group 1)